jgi:hypothetical protein
LLAEAVGLLAWVALVEFVKDGIGLAVEGLSAESALLGELCDVAVASVDDGRGAGESVEGW